MPNKFLIFIRERFAIYLKIAVWAVGIVVVGILIPYIVEWSYRTYDSGLPGVAVMVGLFISGCGTWLFFENKANSRYNPR
jgi:hypothetical protein